MLFMQDIKQDDEKTSKRLKDSSYTSRRYHSHADSGIKGFCFELTAFSDADHAGCIGRMPTKIELTLEQSQQGVSNDVLVGRLLQHPITKNQMLLIERSSDDILMNSARTFRVILFSIYNEKEILPVSSSNNTAVGDLRDSFDIRKLVSTGIDKDLEILRILPDPCTYLYCKMVLRNQRWEMVMLIPAAVDSHHNAHAQATKTYYKHQDLRIMRAQELKTKTFAQTLIYKIFLQRYQVYQGRLLASFQDDAKYEHVGQDIRMQGGKDDKGRQRQRSEELNDKINLIDLTKECHNELTSGEIVSLKILVETMEVHSNYIRSSGH
ncbi:hypothetical protein Tco_0770360 [Tanacetum coccineum]|uniref:Uncharacterized protein n=1 Tax=Tanacetum coccineum TaxID=301880 RepID=A0ABQ4ZC01_9ASTR